MELSLKVIQDLGNMKIVSGYKNRLEYLLNKAERVFILLNDIKSSPYTLIYNYYDILTDEDSGSYKRLDILRVITSKPCRYWFNLVCNLIFILI